MLKILSLSQTGPSATRPLTLTTKKSNYSPSVEQRWSNGSKCIKNLNGNYRSIVKISKSKLNVSLVQERRILSKPQGWWTSLPGCVCK